MVYFDLCRQRRQQRVSSLALPGGANSALNIHGVAARFAESSQVALHEARHHIGLGGLTPTKFVRSLSQVEEPDEPLLPA